MPGFLETLLIQARQGLEGARPRPLQPFEAAPRFEESWEEQAGPLVVVAPVPQVSTGPPTRLPAPPASSATPVPPAREARPAPERAATRDVPRSVPESGREPASTRQAAPLASPRSTSGLAEAAGSVREEPPARSAAPVREEAASPGSVRVAMPAHRPSQPPLRDASPGVLPADARAESGLHGEAAPAGPAPTVAAERALLPPRTDNPAPVPALPRPSPFAESRPVPARREPTAPPPVAPTIEVHIGRIEVRAVTPARPERRTPAAPALSLSDYLAQQSSRP